MLQRGNVLFPVRKTHWYVPKRPLGCSDEGCKGSQGDDFYAAPNPPFGAVFTYHLRDGLTTRESRRPEAAKPKVESGEDTPFPGWETVEAERREPDPAVLLTVRDAAGNVVRRLEGPAKQGFHRVAWDLRHPAPDAMGTERNEWQGPPRGYLAAAILLDEGRGVAQDAAAAADMLLRGAAADNAGIRLPDRYAIALRWTALEENSSLIDAVLAIDAATDFDSFRDALRLFDVPSQNMVYADVDGNIGAWGLARGGMGAISPHPMETPELLQMAGDLIARPLIDTMKAKGYLRPCILYPGCFVSLNNNKQPTHIRVSEINIRPGEPEAQPVARRLRNLGTLIEAMFDGRLNRVEPEVREDQLAICAGLVTGPGGPDGQKGYPWSCTKGEPVEIDFNYIRKKSIQIIPSAMTCSEKDNQFKSDGTRVAWMNANARIKPDDKRGEVAERFRNKLLSAFDNGKVRVIPREDPQGNRLDLRRDIGLHYLVAEKIFPEK